jgi:GT2 family glycosyltransferase
MKASAAAIGVVVIVRNGVRFIAQALDSIAAQTVTPTEVLVIDGGSTDGTREAVAARGDVRLIAQASTGIAAAYNEAIALTRCDLVAFLSSDDLWTPDKIERHIALMAQRPDLLFSVSLVQHFLEPGCSPQLGFRRELLDAPAPGFIMEALVARKTAFEIVGPFDPRFDVGEDTDWFARARDLGAPFEIIDAILVRKRVHDANASLNDSRINEHLLAALRRSVARKRAASS